MMFKKIDFLWSSLFALCLIGPAQAATPPATVTTTPIATDTTKTKVATMAKTSVKVATTDTNSDTDLTKDTGHTTAKASATVKVIAPEATGDVIKDSDIPQAPAVESADNLSSYNRVVFHFNDTLDKAILKPVATLYNKVVPKPLHRGVSNIFSNIDTIPTVVNDVLQIKIYHAASDAWRLIINSTVGILGFFDVASKMGLKPHHEDFGLTLAHWGYKDSNYFVVPFFGPGTIRDVMGWPVDYFFFSIYPHISNTTVRYSIYGVGVVDRRSNFLQYQDVYEQVAVDRYAFMRNAYLQHRKYQIDENNESTKESPAESGQDLGEASPAT